jgi:hypothetical protein
VTRLASFGKNQGDLPGAPRTGNDLKTASITVPQIAKGKLVEIGQRLGRGRDWAEAEKDGLGFLRQNGVMPAPQHLRG